MLAILNAYLTLSAGEAENALKFADSHREEIEQALDPVSNSSRHFLAAVAA